MTDGSEDHEANEHPRSAVDLGCLTVSIYSKYDHCHCLRHVKSHISSTKVKKKKGLGETYERLASTKVLNNIESQES